MKQVAQRLRDGTVEVLDVPEPALTPESVVVDVRASLLSAGTERAKVEAGRKSLIAKARSRPDEVAKVIDRARSDGLRDTIRAVRARLDQPSALGYSASGVVLAVGARVRDLAPGDRVACAGGDHAVHADVVQVPGNLCMPLPGGVRFEQGAFATVGSVAMHGVRQADVRIGERVAVIGLGLVGQLTGLILRAAGCHVVGIDLSDALVEKALELPSADAAFNRAALNGNELPAAAGSCDAVIITAATTSSDPIDLAARLCRDRGRVVVVGDVGIDVPRGPYYERELELRLSRSYGPGRYDDEYEERGLDYPIGYVRWTERRNMGAFLELIASERIDVDGLILERVPVEGAVEAYEQLLSADVSPLGIVLHYDSTPIPARRRTTSHLVTQAPASWNVANVIGVGSFAQRVLIPGLKGTGIELRSAASARGLSARAAVEQFGFLRAVTPQEAITDPEAGLVAIATRHASHATLAEAALLSGKAVFVEKPPALTGEELARLREARASSGRPLFVGFNRRFAPLARQLTEHVRATSSPIELLVRVNAGRLAGDHWLNEAEDGGGRLLGEGCHFIDFACWVVGRPVSHVSCSMSREPGIPVASSQGFSVTLNFSDRSLATIFYTARGASVLAKEYVEAHAGGRSAVLDDFRSLRLMTGHKVERKSSGKQDKGHRAQLAQLREDLRAGVPMGEPDPLDSMDVTLEAVEAARISVDGLSRGRTVAQQPNGRGS
jgi:predicted dehydrogenase/threonine dehydrogenase-like Zn-dependent dehydrogenase